MILETLNNVGELFCFFFYTFLNLIIFQSNVDIRLKLAENIVLIGGTVMAKGFAARLKEELLEKSKSPKYIKLKITTFKFHIAPVYENYISWLGGKYNFYSFIHSQ